MERIFRRQVEQFVLAKFLEIDRLRAATVAESGLVPLLQATNPYLECVRHHQSSVGIVRGLVDIATKSIETETFEKFLTDLATFVSEQKCNGRKSGITGIDIELEREGVRYLIAVKSGNAWGNATQHKKLGDNFQTAVRVLKQNPGMGAVQPTLGICYGRFKTVNNGAFLHIGGQSFWELLSYEPDLYMDLIEPIGYRAKQFNEEFEDNRNKALNRMVREFTERFCLADGTIDWPKIVTLVSKNA
jgi:hypothetical protein